jgi:hypothetical protein
MANLISVNSSFLLSPQNLLYDNDKYQWIRTECTLTLSIKEQTLLLQSKPYSCIQKSNFLLLIAGVRNFVEQLRARGAIIDSRRAIAEFLFVPLELDFEFACLNGDISEDGEGEVTLRIMLNLGTIDESLSSEYVGGIMNVSLATLLTFIDTLEAEVALAASRTL